MAYTAADQAAVRASIMALVRGERVVSVSVDGQTVQYQAGDLDKLRALDSEISRSLQATTGRRSYYVISTGKGL